jgi:hypothetical protein
VVTGAARYESDGDALYDPATDTIYDPPSTVRTDAPPAVAGKAQAGRVPAWRSTRPEVAGDPLVDKVRVLLRRGDMIVTGPETHEGTEAWTISLRADEGRPVWTLWVSAADGRPLELRDPGRDASEAPQVIRWPTYEVLPGADAAQTLSLTGAHPTARVVRDPAQVAAAEQRLTPAGP